MRIKFCKVQFLAWPLGENWIFRLPCFSVALVFFFFIITLYRFVIWKARKKPVIFSRNENGNIQWKIRCCSWIACLWYEATRCGQKSRGKLRKRNIYQRHAIFGSWINWLFAHVGAEPMERNYQPKSWWCQVAPTTVYLLSSCQRKGKMAVFDLPRLPARPLDQSIKELMTNEQNGK